MFSKIKIILVIQYPLLVLDCLQQEVAETVLLA